MDESLRVKVCDTTSNITSHAHSSSPRYDMFSVAQVFEEVALIHPLHHDIYIIFFLAHTQHVYNIWMPHPLKIEYLARIIQIDFLQISLLF